MGERVLVNLPNMRVVAAVGAHPDDIEIGAAGTLLHLSERDPQTEFVFVVATGSETRRAEAEESARDLLGDRVTVSLLGADDGMLPYRDPAAVKEWMRSVLPDSADLVLAPWRHDRHQDHRFVAELAWQICRDTPIFQYGIPKWEPEDFTANVHVALSDEASERKVEHLMSHFSSQHGKPWYRPELFRSALVMAGVGAGASRAEGFVAESLVFG